jgi:hypothetical protein
MASQARIDTFTSQDWHFRFASRHAMADHLVDHRRLGNAAADREPLALAGRRTSLIMPMIRARLQHLEHAVDGPIGPSMSDTDGKNPIQPVVGRGRGLE